MSRVPGVPERPCNVILESYMTIIHCLASEIYLELRE